jgi:hypothetical protein
LPLIGFSLARASKVCVLAGGTVLCRMASALLEHCEVVARAVCGVVVVAKQRSGRPRCILAVACEVVVRAKSGGHT